MTSRSAGVHVSDVIKDMCVKLGVFGDSDSPDTPTLTSTWAEFGNAFEDSVIARLQEAYPNRYVQPGEITVDGIHGTPDLYDVIDDAVVEIKLTWMSADVDPEGPKFWRYEQQIKAYCWMLNTARAYLHVAHVNGNYKPLAPTYNVWATTYSQRELYEHWALIRSRARTMKE